MLHLKLTGENEKKKKMELPRKSERREGKREGVEKTQNDGDNENSI